MIKLTFQTLFFHQVRINLINILWTWPGYTFYSSGTETRLFTSATVIEWSDMFYQTDIHFLCVGIPNKNTTFPQNKWENWYICVLCNCIWKLPWTQKRTCEFNFLLCLINVLGTVVKWMYTSWKKYIMTMLWLSNAISADQ